MAKDPAFLYYDGDAAKDVAHMNRLERGCYLDLIHAQRKRGHLSIDDIKKVLGKDFECCWDAIEWVLEKDNTAKYFIEWLEDSTEKRKAYSESRRKNKICKTHDKDMMNISSRYDEDMENENEDENKDENKVIKEESVRETKLEPVEERKSEFGGPTYGEVKGFFIQNNRSSDEALVFWNEYEQKEWCVVPIGDGPPRKLKRTKDWMLKAEQWIVRARKEGIDKTKKNKSSYVENSTYQPAEWLKHKLDEKKECAPLEKDLKEQHILWVKSLWEKYNTLPKSVLKFKKDKILQLLNEKSYVSAEQLLFEIEDAQNKSSPRPENNSFNAALKVVGHKLSKEIFIDELET